MLAWKFHYSILNEWIEIVKLLAVLIPFAQEEEKKKGAKSNFSVPFQFNAVVIY